MSTNMGTIDRGLRLVVAAILLFAAFGTAYAAVGVLHWVAIAVAIVFTLTALVGTCPLYSIVGIRTCRVT